MRDESTRAVQSRRIGRTQADILEWLKRHGRGVIPEIAESLALSVETIRSHLRSLRSSGLVQRLGSRSSGPGRPEIVYALTSEAEVLFPRGEVAMLRDLAAFLRDRGHDALMSEFFDEQIEARRANVRERISGADPVDRLDAMVGVLNGEGFMAETSTDPEGRRTLRLCHCPYRTVVDATSAPCRSELRFMRDVLGERLVRTSYIPDGDPACSYRIEADR